MLINQILYLQLLSGLLEVKLERAPIKFSKN